MNVECYPISLLPHLSKLFLDFASSRQALEPFYAATAYSTEWVQQNRALSAGRRSTLCELLAGQNLAGTVVEAAGAASEVPDLSQLRKNLKALAEGAGAVVTGQQVSLLGGPLYTLLKAATAVRKARDASDAGHPHVPIFWLASEDHDLAEANQVHLPHGERVETLRIHGSYRAGAPVGGIQLGPEIEPVLAMAGELLSRSGPSAEALWKDITACYQPEATFAEACGGMIRRIFAPYGLIVIDAASRPFHALGCKVLREAILHAAELHQALENRGCELEAAGYHAQVLVAAESSLLFLVEKESGARVPLHRPAGGSGNGEWQAGRQSYSTEDLLAILDNEPERLSPNALLRPVFQDCILPTSVYIGGPSEIAYFAQSKVLYEHILDRSTPVEPRLSATLIEPEVAGLLDRHRISLPEIVEASAKDPLELAQRLGARALPLATREKLDAADKALEDELASLTTYLNTLSPDLGRAAGVGASKMRYQMSRLRRLASNDQLRRDRSLAEDAATLQLNLFPNRHPQERVFGLVWFLARHGSALVDTLVEAAAQDCPGHRAIRL